MSVLRLSLLFSLLFTAFTRVNCSLWATARTQSCVSLAKKNNPFHCCDSNEQHCRNVAQIWNRGGNLPIMPQQQVTIFSLKPTSPRDDSRRQAQSVTPPADTELCSQVNQQVQIQPSKQLISTAENQWRRHSKQVTISSSGFNKSGEAHCCGNWFADEEVVFETCCASDSRGN